MGKQKSAESTNGSAQAFAQPFAKQGLQDVQSVYNQNQPNLQATTDMQRQQVVNPLISQFQNTQAPANQASNFYSGVLNNNYGSGNPYLKQVTDTANRQINDNVNSQFEGAGRYGSDAYAGTLARETGAADAQLGYNNYNDNLNRMGQAAAGATGASIGTEQALAGAVGQNAALPYTGTQAMAGSLGQLMNGGTSVQYSPNPIFGALGAGLGAAGSVFQGAGTFSDRRLKTKIELLYRDPDGLGHYAYEYKKAPGIKLKGVMAQEVRELRPAAYVENYGGSGFHGVNYAAL